MKQQVNTVINYLKEQPYMKGCITGSCMLDKYYEGMDIDLFVYDEKSFTNILWNLYYNKEYVILENLEGWKFDQFVTKVTGGQASWGVTTIKFLYNTCVPVNIILKRNCKNIFDVLASFDMDIICKGYDIKTKQTLDLLGDSVATKIASFNKWNNNFYDPELWQVSRILRQLDRCIKYHKRGFNTDAVVLKYIELIDSIQEYQNIFNSNDFSEKLKIKKRNTKVVKKICEAWLETHEISDKQLELLQDKIKEITDK